MLQIFDSYNFTGKPMPNILAVCGMGSPNEAQEDPDNNRCSPCPHVADALTAFNFEHPDLSKYIS